MSFWCSILSDVITTIIVGVALLWITHKLSRPKIKISSLIESTPKKWVGSWKSGDRRSSTDTIDIIERTSEGNYYYFYLLKIENHKHWFLDSEAIVIETSMKIWDEKNKIFNHKKGCRWWSGENVGSDPLFTEGKASLKEKWSTKIPIYGEKHIVIAYRQIDRDIVYRFSTDTDEKNGFLKSDDKLSLPCYLLIELFCERLPKQYIKLKGYDSHYAGICFEVIEKYSDEIESVL